jgi:hypothetical protein
MQFLGHRREQRITAMATIFSLLAGLCDLAALVFAIIILIELFKREGVLMGILGIICGLYTYIWGWIKAPEHGKRQIMVYWTAAIIGAVVFSVLAGAMARA